LLHQTGREVHRKRKRAGKGRNGVEKKEESRAVYGEHPSRKTEIAKLFENEKSSKKKEKGNLKTPCHSIAGGEGTSQ